MAKASSGDLPAKIPIEKDTYKCDSGSSDDVLTISLSNKHDRKRDRKFQAK